MTYGSQGVGEKEEKKNQKKKCEKLRGSKSVGAWTPKNNIALQNAMLCKCN